NGYFSIAKRPLWFETDDTTVLTAVCSTRYVHSKFIEIPLRLTFSIGRPSAIRYDRSKMGSNFNYTLFEQKFNSVSQSSTLKIESSISTEQIHNIADLSFSITAGSNSMDVLINIKYIKYSNFNWEGLSGCLCLFKTTYESRTRLKEPP